MNDFQRLLIRSAVSGAWGTFAAAMMKGSLVDAVAVALLVLVTIYVVAGWGPK